MKTKTPNTLLQEKIDLLEFQRNQELLKLKRNTNTLVESLNPINLIKSGIEAVTTSPKLKNGVGNTVLGVASGWAVKHLLFGKSKNPLKIMAGLALQTAVTDLTAKNADKIKSKGQQLLLGILSKMNF